MKATADHIETLTYDTILAMDAIHDAAQALRSWNRANNFKAYRVIDRSCWEQFEAVYKARKARAQRQYDKLNGDEQFALLLELGDQAIEPYHIR